MQRQITAGESELKSAINELTAKGQAIGVREVAALTRGEGELDFVKGLDAILNDETTLNAHGTVLDANMLNRLKMFNIKVSVLEFIERIANYDNLLKKHFRGYLELISFSSKTFYQGQLQAVKSRGKRIEGVIRFTDVAHDGRAETAKNTNGPEAEAILKELRELGNR